MLTRDMVVSDGEILNLGNTTLTLHHATWRPARNSPREGKPRQ